MCLICLNTKILALINALTGSDLMVLLLKKDNIVHIIDGIEHQFGIKNGLLQCSKSTGILKIEKRENFSLKNLTISET